MVFNAISGSEQLLTIWANMATLTETEMRRFRSMLKVCNNGKVLISFWALSLGLSSESCFALSPIEINDLKLVSVELLSQRQIPKQDKDWKDSEITEPLFMVTFSSKTDMEMLAKRYSYNIDNITSICRQSSIDRERRLRGFPSVYDAVGEIDTFRGATDSQSVTGEGSEFIYHIYFDIKMSNNVNLYSFDLIQKPENICITVNGAQEIGFYVTNTFTSNTLIIPKEMISMAIDKAVKSGDIEFRRIPGTQYLIEGAGVGDHRRNRCQGRARRRSGAARTPKLS